MPSRASWNRSAVESLAAGQGGFVTAKQLESLGVPRSTVHAPAGVGGMFSWVLPGVHRLGPQRGLTEEEKNQVALLYVGYGAVLTGRSVLLRHSVRAASDCAVRPVDRVHVLVSWQRQRSSHDFVMVERTWRFPRSTRVHDDLAEASMARAALDACRRCSS